MAAALTMKEKVVFFFNMMLELGFDESYIDNTSALHVAGNRTYSPRATHIALKVFLHARTGGGGQGRHPQCQERGSAGRLRHQAP